MQMVKQAQPQWRVVVSCSFSVVALAAGLVLMGLLLTRDYDPQQAVATDLPVRRLSQVYNNLQVTQLDFAPDGRQYAAKQGLQVPQLVVRNTADDSAVAVVSDSFGFGEFRFRADGNAVIFTDLLARETLLSYDLNSGEIRVVLAGLRGLTTFDVAPQGGLVATSLSGRLVGLYDMRDGRLIANYAVNDAVQALQFNRRGDWLAVHMTHSVLLIDVRTGVRHEQPTPYDSSIGAVAMADDTLYIGTSSGQIIARDLNTHTDTLTAMRVAGPVQALDINPRGDRLAALIGRGFFGSGHVSVWTVATTTAPVRRVPLADGGHGLYFRPDGQLVVLPAGVPDADPVFVQPPLVIAVDDAIG